VVNLIAFVLLEKVKIMCCLHHDELKVVFHVSKRIRKAVSIILTVAFFICKVDKSLFFPHFFVLIQFQSFKE
jgi:hypothetical protein